MLPTEIERKYTIIFLPKKIEKILMITQKHIYKDSICSIRVRKSENLNTKEVVYTHTIKAKGNDINKFSTIELEKNITKEQYEASNPFKGSEIIEKYRLIIPLENGLKAEVDIFQKRLKGLIIAEVEFESVEQAEKFKMPSWFEKRKEVLEIIGKKQLAINEKILKDFRKRI